MATRDLPVEIALASNAALGPTVPVNRFFTANAGYTSYAVYGGAGTCTIQPARIPFAMTVSEVRIRVAVAASAGQTLRLVAYNMAANGCDPGTLLADWGTVAADSIGVKAVTGLATALPAGLIWLGIAPMSDVGSPGSVYTQPSMGQPGIVSGTTMNVLNCVSVYANIGTGTPTSPFPTYNNSNSTCGFEFKRSA